MKKILSSNSLKFIAVLAMLLDHIAFSFIPYSSVFYFIFRIIGRITVPVMFMGIANGYNYTSNKFKYGLRLLGFALVSQIPYSLFMEGKFFLVDNYNILFTLFLGFVCLYIFYNVKNMFMKIIFIILCFIFSCFCEYGLFGISLALMFSLCKNGNFRILFYSLMCLVYIIFSTILNKSFFIFVIYLGLFLFIPLLTLYNGKKGKYNLKYVFYVFYPFHLFILILLKLLFC